MSNDPNTTAQPDSKETSIEFPDEGVTINTTMTMVGQGLYRLDTVPLMVESAGFRDVIEAEALPAGGLKFLRVARKSDWRIYDFVLNKATTESPKLQELLDRVTDQGGHWERSFGGCLFICLPPDVVWNPTPEVMGEPPTSVDERRP